MPTPVSALIHAATMVTAGIFLIIRCSSLFEAAPTTLLFITLIGAATAFMAATAGLVQNDLKKIIAYSTCSQLGYMAFACGLSQYTLSLFHLTNHAFFKALLFLSAGAVIHAVSNEQDLRKLGGFLRLLPYSYGMFLIGSLALMGFPFLTGFYSKDLILEVAAGTDRFLTLALYTLPVVTAFFTAFYSFRLMDLAFYSSSRSPRTYLLNTHELTGRMALALAVLSVGSIFFGYMARDIFIGFGTPFWNGVVYTAASNIGAQLNGEFIPLAIKLIPLFGAALSVTIVCVTNRVQSPVLNAFLVSNARLVLTRFLSHKWYFDTVYNRLVNQPLLIVSYDYLFKGIDKGVLELVGPTGLARVSARAGRSITNQQTGVVYYYAAFMLVALIVFYFGLIML